MLVLLSISWTVVASTGRAADGSGPVSGRVEVEAGVELHYEIHGRGGRDLVVPLGLVVGDLSIFHDDFRVTVYDPRGRGRSTALGPGIAAGWERDLADLEAILRALGIGRASFLGASYYGALVAAHAARRPLEVDRVVMLGPMSPTARTFFGGPPPPASDRDGSAAPPAAETPRSSEQSCRQERRAAAGAVLFDAGAFDESSADSCAFENERREGVERWARAVFRDLGDWDLRAEAAAVRAPVLVVQGSGDRIAPPDGAREWVAVLPGAELLWVEACGHLPWRERSRIVRPAVLDFLSEVRVEPGRAPEPVGAPAAGVREPVRGPGPGGARRER